MLPTSRPLSAGAILAITGFGLLLNIPTSAANLVLDFSENAGLGYGVGTSTLITEDGIKLVSIAGTYEVTLAPKSELNLKDFGGKGSTRTVVFSLASGGNFDFIGFTRTDGYGDWTLTTNRGDSTTFNLFSPPDLSGPKWDDLSSVTLSTSTQYGESKFDNFVFNDVPTSVPEPTTLAVLTLTVFALNTRRRR
jgi:hypothetical protein